MVIPLEDKAKDHTNPLYSTPPGSRVLGSKLWHCVPDGVEEVVGTNFGIGEIYGKLFLFAKVKGPIEGYEGYMNIWQGTSLDRKGTLYCTLAYSPNYGWRCLCGKCSPGWSAWGWVCPVLQCDEGTGKRKRVEVAEDSEEEGEEEEDAPKKRRVPNHS